MSFQLTLAQLREMSEDELVQAHDKAVRTPGINANDFREELQRREQDRWLEQQKKSEQQMMKLTVTNTVFAALALICALVALFK